MTNYSIPTLGTVKLRIELKKQLHYTPLVPLIVLLLVRSPLSYMQIKSLFPSSVNAHFASNYPALSPLTPDTTSLKVSVNSVPSRSSYTR